MDIETSGDIPAKEISKYVCTSCGKSFAWRSGLSRHKKLFHASNKLENYKTLSGDQCFSKEIELSDPFNARKRQEEHKKDKISKIYEKVISETLYSSDSDCEYEVLQTIVKVQSDKGDKKCEMCGKIFLKQQSLNRHLKHHEIDQNKSTVTEDGKCNMFSCDKCNKSFKKACNLSNHLKLHLSESVIAKKLEQCKNKILSTKNFYPCYLCNRVYLKQSHLQNHLLLNNHRSTRKYVCDKLRSCVICAKGFSTALQLSLHMKTHVDSRLHLCSVCGNNNDQIMILDWRLSVVYRKIICPEEIFDSSQESPHTGKVVFVPLLQ